MKPVVISGGEHQDNRGVLRYNNLFDLSLVKRMYIIQNSLENPVRGWQGHKIESRWFCAMTGKIRISLVKIKNWDQPKKNQEIQDFILIADDMDILAVPPGYITRLELIDGAKLAVFSDYKMGEIVDEYRYELDYFNK